MARNEISVVVDVKGRIDNFRAAAEQMQGYLNKLELPKMAENKSASIFSQLSREIEKIQNLTAKGKIDLIDDKNIKTAYHNIENLIGQLEDLSNSPAVRGAWSKDLIQGWNKANSAIKDYMASMKELENRQAKLQGARAGAQGRLNTASAKKQNLLETAGIRQTKYEKQIIEQSEAQGRVAAQAYQRAYETYLSQHPTSKFHKLGQDAWKNSLSKGQIAEINKTMTDKNVVNEADLAKALKLDETRVKLDGIKQIIDDIINNKRIDIGAAAEHGMTGEAKAYNLDLPNVQKIQQEIDAIDDSLNKITQEAAPKFNELRQQLLQIQGIDWSKILPQGKDLNNASIEEIVQSLANFAAAQNEAVDNSTELKKSFENVARGAREVSQPLEKAGEDLETLRERSQNAQQTLSRLQYYFSSVSVFMLFRRAIRSARDAVKELDDAMTETAVVTNYTISDLWKKLPEYTKRANELGVSTLAAYQSATLYYQQGLNDTQVSEMSVETLKMARIAGIEAADATNLMTGAIRAFNMEINKMSAQRVNDVYNKLAAMTAANTEGIATAMTKVASIAHSVGAEFENVAAFLAQMIETTQEAPETLGTALKTVFARFAEVKKLYSEGQITGSDEEGEEINVNKIQEALRTVGISMTDFLVGNEGLDQVIMRLAQKWDSLDTVTQRYIATMAAGSRQQSRFISLLQDFGRTQELINAANNSEGAAQKQFEKTLDSLQSKTEQLKNAWNEFLLDLANSDVIKGVVDLLNNLVTALNKITGAFGSRGSGISKLLLGLGMLKGGRALLGGAKYMMDPTIMGKYNNNRLMAFRAGASAQMGFSEKDYSPSTSLVGATVKQRIATPWSTLFHTKDALSPNKRIKASEQAIEQAKADVKGYEKAYQQAQQEVQSARRSRDQHIEYFGDENHPAVQRAQENLENKEKAELDAKNNLEGANTSLKQTEENAVGAGQALQQYGQAATAVGQAAGVAAGLCFLLANALEKSGNVKAAKALKTIGTTLVVLSGLFRILGTVAQITGAQIATGAKTASTAIMNIPIIGWIAAVIAAVISLIAIISSLIETSEERMERLQSYVEHATEAANEAKQAYEDLLKTKSEYGGLLDELKNLVEGTLEYKKALLDIQDINLDLASKYGSLIEYEDVNGTRAITDESWNRILDLQLKRQQITQWMLVGAKLDVSKEELDQSEDKLDTRNESLRHYLRFNFDYDSPNKAAEAIKKWLVQKGEKWEDYQDGQKSFADFTQDELLDLKQFLKHDEDLLRALFQENIGSKAEYMSSEELDIEYAQWKTRFLNNTYDHQWDQQIDELIEAQTENNQLQNKLTSEAEANLIANTTIKGKEGEAIAKIFAANYTPKDREFERYSNGGYSGALPVGIKATEGAGKDFIAALEKMGVIEQGIYDQNYYTYDTMRSLLSRATGMSLEDLNKYTDKEIEALINNFLDTYESNTEMEEYEKTWLTGKDELKTAIVTALTDSKNLSKFQLDTIKEGWNYLDEQTKKRLAGDLRATETDSQRRDRYYNTNNNWKNTRINASELYSRAAETQLSNFEHFGLQEIYETLFEEIESSDLSKEQKQEILSAFNSADIKNIDSLWKTFEILKNKGIDLSKIAPSLYNNFIEVINKLDEFGVAIKQWTQESAKTTMVNAQSIINQIIDNQSREFSKEQYQYIEELFTRTGNTDELKYFAEQTDGKYKYVGDNLSTIVSLLTTIAGKIPTEFTETKQVQTQISDALQEGIKINKKQFAEETLSVAKKNFSDFITKNGGHGKAIQQNPAEYHRLERAITTAEWDYQHADQSIILEKEDLEKFNETQQIAFYNSRINELGLSNTELAAAGLVGELNSEMSSEEISEYWRGFLDLVFNNEQLHKALQDGVEREALIGLQDVTEISAAAKGKGRWTNISEDNKLTAEGILQNKLEETGEAEATFNRWIENNNTIKETDSLYKALAIDSAELTKRTKELGKALEDPIKNFKEAKKKGKDLDESLQEIRNALKKLYGPDFKISNKDLIEKMPLIEKMQKGGKEAEQAGREFGKTYAKNIYDGLNAEQIGTGDIIENFVKDIQSNYDAGNIDPIEITIPIDGNVDNTNLLNALNGSVADLANYQGTLLEIEVADDGESIRVIGSYGGFSGISSSKSGGGGGGKTSPWENPYDKYHNLLQEIDELLRTRNDLERQYEKILANRHSTIQDILKNSRENLANLEREIVAQKMLQKGRQEQFRNLAKDDYYFDEKGKRRSFAQQAAEFGINLSDYARYNEETQEMEINWDAFEEVERRSETDAKWAEVGKFLQKYYDKLKELTDSYEDTQDTIEEMEDAIQEILERSKEDYIDFEQELYDALVDHVQQYIDAEQKLSDTIKDAESKVLDHLRESIDLERQIRDNTKTEEDIADKENRLAYLQRDTTGANAVEIMQLQKEIQEARENYQDTLVDQELERLNRISEEAAQQREHQIELMQEQLDWAQKAGYFWDEVESILQTALKSGDTSLIEQLLKGVGDFNEKSMFGDRAWKDELIERFLKASEGRANWELDNAKENHTSWASRIAATGKEGTVGIWWDAEKEQWVDAKGNTYTGVGYDVQTGKWKYEDRSDRVKEETERPPSSGGSGTQSQSGQNEKPKQKTYSSTQKYNGYEGTATSKTSQKDADSLAMKNAINTAIGSWQTRAAKILEGINELEITMRAAYSVSRPSIQAQIDELKDIHSNLMAKIRLANIDLRQYKTGGLATQTGPAWLDGTPSKPEYVLNAAQTQAFLQLADVLPSMISGGSSLTNAPTAVNIDIDINVDSIANDYDVDRLCDRVKEDLYSDLMYRNINVVNLRR